MSILDLYADRIGADYDRRLRNPGAEPEPAGFSTWAFLGAGAKGLPSGALEGSGSTADLLSGFGTAMAASGGTGQGMFSVPTDDEKKQEAEARKRMLEGRSFDFTAGNTLRRKAEEFAPDPLTSHKADQVIHGITRFGGKAVAAVTTMGVVPGAAVLGLEEANTSAQRLRMQGVDDATAAKVGLVQGGISAASVVLPVAGPTLKTTLGLVAVGGPGGYMAQEALSRDILQKAGYADQASLHDPFDPLGLTLSTVLPGAFGGVHLRSVAKRAKAVESGAVPLEQLKPEEIRKLRYDDPRLDQLAEAAAERHGVPPAILLAIKNAGERSGPNAVSEDGAQGVMQFMEATAKEMGLKDRTDPAASIDAAARYLRKLYNAYGSWDAAIAHYNGGGAQAALVRGGAKPSFPETAAYLERVQKYVAERTAEQGAKSPEVVDAARVRVLNDTVARSLPDHPEAHVDLQRVTDMVAAGRVVEDVPHPERIRWEAEMEQIEAQRAELLPVAANLAERGEIRAAREELRLMEQQRPDTSEPAIKALAKDLQAEERVSYKVALAEANKRVSQEVGDFTRRVERLEGFIARNAEAQRATQALGELDKRADAAKAELDRLPLTMPRAVDQVPAERTGAAPNELPAPERVELQRPAPQAQKPTLATPQARPAGTAETPAANAGEGKDSDTGGAAPSLDAQMAAKLAQEQPDLQVILPGGEKPVSVAEALRRIKQEQQDEAGMADLLRVAAECALMG